MRKRLLNIVLFIVSLPLHPQTGGDNVYEFLNLTHSGLVSSIGGNNVSLFENLNMSYHNPALLNASMNKSLVIDFTNYFAGINYGLVMYGISSGEKYNFAAGITYLNYGSFTEADATGNLIGTFTASEYALNLILSRNIDSLFSVGVNLKPILSHLEKYNSFGIAFDIGLAWHSRSRLISAGLTARNTGYQITTYAGEQRQKLPFEVIAGFSARLAHAPFRFSLTARHLEKFDLTYQYAGTEDEQNNGVLENIMRHMIAGVELIPHKNFYFSAGYNYQRRRELQTEAKVSTSGLSWGFGIRSSYISIEFGRSAYHLAGSSNHISLIMKPDMIISDYLKK
ncbi:MAG: type IX secretion system protein PorQ [Bacteroidales bacterium]|nr:type IX secretion system protein PorQ [Bacteroidales bacterium]